MNKMEIEVTTLHQFHKGVLAFKNTGHECSIHPEMLESVKYALSVGRIVVLSNTYMYSQKTTNRLLLGWY